jgi:hypothetical protein
MVGTISLWLWAIAVSPVLAGKPEPCITIHDLTARLTRPNLQWLLTLQEGSNGNQILGQLGQPYCSLAASDRQQRWAYPAAWDPATWIVILIQEGRYSGYSFTFGNPGGI